MSGAAAAICLAGATAFLLLDLALSVVLLAATSLSRVALRRLNAESGDALHFIEELKSLPSAHRAAIHTVRQASLLSAGLLFAVAAERAGLPHPWLWGLAFALVAGVLVIETFLARLLVFHDPRAALRVTALLVRPVHMLTYPLLVPLHVAFRRWSSKSVEDEERDEDSSEEVEAFIEVGERDGILEAAEGEMVRGIVDLDDTLVREIMTPRTDIAALPDSATVREAAALFLRHGHARVPVYHESIDNVVGVLHVHEVLAAMSGGYESNPVTGYLRPAFFVPETQSVAELLAQMRTKTHIALVVDEYGALVGLATLEDLLEEIVGEIRDEHESAEARLVQEQDGSWVVSGKAHVEEIEDLFELDVSERDYDTVGGFVVSSLGRVPAIGESFEIGGLRVETLEADRRRVYRVRIRRANGRGPIVGGAP